MHCLHSNNMIIVFTWNKEPCTWIRQVLSRLCSASLESVKAFQKVSNASTLKNRRHQHHKYMTEKPIEWMESKQPFPTRYFILKFYILFHILYFTVICMERRQKWWKKLRFSLLFSFQDNNSNRKQEFSCLHVYRSSVVK